MTTLTFGFPSLRPLMGKKQNLSLGDTVLIRSSAHCFKTGFSLSLIAQMVTMNKQLKEKPLFVVFTNEETSSTVLKYIRENIKANNPECNDSRDYDIVVFSNLFFTFTPGQFTQDIKHAKDMGRRKIHGVFVDNISNYIDERGNSAEDAVLNELNAARIKENFLLLVTKNTTISCRDPEKPFGGYPKVKDTRPGPLTARDSAFNHTFLLDITPPHKKGQKTKLHVMNDRKPDLGIVSLPFEDKKTICWKS